MASKVQQLSPLLDIQSAAFAKHYKDGVWWSMHGEEQGNGLVSVHYLVTNLRQYEERNQGFTPLPPPAHLEVE